MKLKICVLLILITTIQYLQSQNESILTDFIELPQDQFNKLYDTDKVTNPLYLNGNVHKVMRTFTQYKSRYSKENYTEHYSYTIDKTHTITDYRSDLEYDDLTAESFTITPELSITNKDTIVSKGNTKYTFKKGLLKLKESRNFEESILDSIIFKYKKGKLIEKVHYTSFGLMEVDDNGEVDESYMLIPEFELASYTKLSYNKLGLIEAYSYYAPNPDIIEVQDNSYTYTTDGKLEEYTLVYNRYYAETIDITKNPRKWKFGTDGIIDLFFEEIKGNYKYDSNGRIIKYKLEKNNKEAELYEVDYNTNGFTIKVRSDYYKKYIHDFENTLLHQDLEYQYTYDALGNPIEIKSYIIDSEGKYLDKSTRLTISYFEE